MWPVAAGDVVDPWRLVEAVKQSDAGSCCEGPCIVAFEHESPPLFPAPLVPPAATPDRSVTSVGGVSEVWMHPMNRGSWSNE
jgi:hypothetical protein